MNPSLDPINPSINIASMSQFWRTAILPALCRYIEIPNQSPAFDSSWQRTGHMARAVHLAADWVKAQDIPGCRLDVITIEDRTPLILLEFDGSGDETILLYGHLDKQPPMTGWLPDLGPWKPVIQSDRLYGRGGADDGYAIFAIIAAVLALKATKQPHGRLVGLIECCEESGSYDLPYYVAHLKDRIGTPDLIICLDSGCGNYDQLWCTTSLRGMVSGTLSVNVLTEGVHSGDASGIIPSSFRIIRQLLDRIEDAKTGDLKPEWLEVEIPPNRAEEAEIAATVLGTDIFEKFPRVTGLRPTVESVVTQVLKRTWHPTLCITGQEGLPGIDQAGNVLRPQTALKLSIRLPPTLASEGIAEKLQALLEHDPPYGAQVLFQAEKAGTGWNAPAMSEWLKTSIQRASTAYFGMGTCCMGEGGSIPFMGMLGEQFPRAQFLITGVLGPNSNAHGPNEFLDIPTAIKLSCCIAQVIADATK